MTKLVQGKQHGIQVLRDGGASSQQNENLLQTMDVSLDQKARAIARKQRVGTQLTTMTGESGIGDFVDRNTSHVICLLHIAHTE